MAVYLGNGAGGFTLKESITYVFNDMGPPPALGDVNGDGILDICGKCLVFPVTR